MLRVSTIGNMPVPFFRFLELSAIASPENQAKRRWLENTHFHVAAYKHVTLVQENPVEASNNNIWGTVNMLKQAVDFELERVVYVSTDKAVNPTHVMSATKRIGELLLHDLLDRDTSRLFPVVRFGNVLESEGSVKQTFRPQLLQRKNLTVTDPEVDRQFMTTDEASQLVFQTATRGTQVNSSCWTRVIRFAFAIWLRDLSMRWTRAWASISSAGVLASGCS